MTTSIEAAATSHPRHTHLGRGALHLSDSAARRALLAGHRHASEIDVLVNVGLYKDHSLAEPALASIIQEDLGANPGHPMRPGDHGTFSFDLLAGGVGVVTAAYVIDSLVGHGPAQLGLIVAGDSDPSPRTSHGFPFSPAGGAMLLAHGDGDRGFVKFRFRSFPEHAGLFEAHTRWDPDAGWTHRGANVLEFYEAPGLTEACIERGREVASELLAEVSLAPSAIELVIASQYPSTFPVELARGLGIAADCVPRVAEPLLRCHTAGPIAALEAAITSGRLASARHTLFVTVGAGLVVGAALYRGAGRS